MMEAAGQVQDPPVEDGADGIDVNEFPYQFEVVPLEMMFVDESYQRPLTSFVEKVEKGFDPALIGTLVLSARKRDGHVHAYAVVDGQTRKEGASRRGVNALPAVVFYDLTRQDEAMLFAKLQRLRRGMHSYHRFRADLVGGVEEAVRIKQIVEANGYTIGIESGVVGQVKAVAALERLYRWSPELLERALIILDEAWHKKHVLDGGVMRGLGYFLRNNKSVDDARLASRLSIVTPEELKRRASALKEGSGYGSTIDKYMSGAIEGVYRRKV